MIETVIVDAVRTPFGKYNGMLKNIRPDDLGAVVIKSLLERNPSLDPSMVEEVVFGNANGAGEDNRNVARMSALLADLPIHASAVTLNRLCGSGLDAVNYAARAIASGEGDVFIAGGTESMTRAPYVMLKEDGPYARGNKQLVDTTIGWRFCNPIIESRYGTESMPQTAENVAAKYKLSRQAQDLFALSSQQKAQTAIEENRFINEIIPLKVKNENGIETVVERDEHPRKNSSMEKLQKLKPLFDQGTVTAGNSSGINDGAAALLLMSKQKASALNLKPLARYVSSATAGVEPSLMGIGPVYSTRKALKRANLTIGDIDLFEINEAFAAQTLACMQELNIEAEKVNVNGGAIAFGHPLGASGARILTTLVHELNKQNKRFGAATMCVGVGQGITTIIERWIEGE
ncbi:thiolase family protein [Jeotgalibacillus campisalis]|uniref:Acetyl-CoA acetyltransferase n=1 Tax=Jeotgalibacillus campisalis TaxID=220754 RepID=A0A0C2VSQ5_9BACL|nr:acetyl-CoA C-acyltransferase [Jeotgalibacillus campisalis]KIL47466.1 acetyl-CoA acetyltransferase [Jeotgalibacillus campisalis]